MPTANANAAAADVGRRPMTLHAVYVACTHKARTWAFGCHHRCGGLVPRTSSTRCTHALQAVHVACQGAHVDNLSAQRAQLARNGPRPTVACQGAHMGFRLPPSRPPGIAQAAIWLSAHEAQHSSLMHSSQSPFIPKRIPATYQGHEPAGHEVLQLVDCDPVVRRVRCRLGHAALKLRAQAAALKLAQPNGIDLGSFGEGFPPARCWCAGLGLARM
jgi:hypothetical protein